jgi:acyl-CoA thioester hydrolase
VNRIPTPGPSPGADRLAELGRASLRFEYTVTRESDGALLAEGFTEHACLDRHTLRPTRLPDSVRQALESLPNR